MSINYYPDGDADIEDDEVTRGEDAADQRLEDEAIIRAEEEEAIEWEEGRAEREAIERSEDGWTQGDEPLPVRPGDTLGGHAPAKQTRTDAKQRLADAQQAHEDHPSVDNLLTVNAELVKYVYIHTACQSVAFELSRKPEVGEPLTPLIRVHTGPLICNHCGARLTELYARCVERAR